MPTRALHSRRRSQGRSRASAGAGSGGCGCLIATGGGVLAGASCLPPVATMMMTTSSTDAPAPICTRRDLEALAIVLAADFDAATNADGRVDSVGSERTRDF